ncbi:MFS transporter [Metabacillus sediminilitoris]|uniref:MFS transporter n=1 Tax=Metabacillus sediminilitoris TaxID=2567941 RepID=A0A4S4BJF8_9BACI|nr:MFS transporter [Metabacillus sediminilitoris]QGQ44838.1 MFS transporter [Metabacillus sediminilitoris]THF74779.1 MFS transporter [Metabacillus sediminilitoris]
MDKQNNRFRWVIFASVMFTYLLMASQRTAPGLITDQVMKDFNVTASTIGLLTSIQFFVYTGLQIPMGILADRFGPNYFLIIGALLTGLGTIIYSLGTHEVVLFFARIMTGTGDATIWVNMVLILGQWFNAKEFVRLIGLAGMTGSLGFVLATVPFSAWIVLLGWRTAFFSAGVLLCLSGILLYFVLLKKPKQIFLNESVLVKNEIQREKTLVLLRRMFSNRQAWALFFCHFGVVGAYVGFISSWAVPYGMNVYGMTRSDASQLIMIGLIGALIGAPLTSWISSRLETIKQPYVVIHITTLLSWSSFLFFKGNPPFSFLIMLFFIIGFGYGASALTFAVVRQSFPIIESGIVSGFANTGGFLSAVLLPSIFGNVLDHFQSASGSIGDGYYFGFITPVIFSMIGLIGVICIKERRQEAGRKTNLHLS